MSENNRPILQEVLASKELQAILGDEAAALLGYPLEKQQQGASAAAAAAGGGGGGGEEVAGGGGADFFGDMEQMAQQQQEGVLDEISLRHRVSDLEAENSRLRNLLSQQSSSSSELTRKLNLRDVVVDGLRKTMLQSQSQSARALGQPAALGFEVVDALEEELAHAVAAQVRLREATEAALKTKLDRQERGLRRIITAKEREIIQLHLQFRQTLSQLRSQHSGDMQTVFEENTRLKRMAAEAEQQALIAAEAQFNVRLAGERIRIEQECQLKVAAKEKEMGYLRECLETQESAAKKLEDTIEGLNKQIDSKERTLQHVLDVELPCEVGRLRQQLNDFIEKESTRGQLSLANLQVEIDNLNQLLEDSKATCDTAVREREEAVKGLSQLKGELHHKDQQAREMQSRLNVMNQTVNALERDQEQSAVEMNFLRRAQHDAEISMSGSMSGSGGSNPHSPSSGTSAQAELQRQLTFMQDDNTHLKSDLGKSQEQLEKTREDLKSVQVTKGALQSRVGELEKMLQDQIAQSRAALEKADKQIHKLSEAAANNNNAQNSSGGGGLKRQPTKVNFLDNPTGASFRRQSSSGNLLGAKPGSGGTTSGTKKDPTPSKTTTTSSSSSSTTSASASGGVDPSTTSTSAVTSRPTSSLGGDGGDTTPGGAGSAGAGTPSSSALNNNNNNNKNQQDDNNKKPSSPSSSTGGFLNDPFAGIARVEESVSNFGSPSGSHHENNNNNNKPSPTTTTTTGPSSPSHQPHYRPSSADGGSSVVTRNVAIQCMRLIDASSPLLSGGGGSRPGTSTSNVLGSSASFGQLGKQQQSSFSSTPPSSQSQQPLPSPGSHRPLSALGSGSGSIGGGSLGASSNNNIIQKKPESPHPGINQTGRVDSLISPKDSSLTTPGTGTGSEKGSPSKGDDDINDSNNKNEGENKQNDNNNNNNQNENINEHHQQPRPSSTTSSTSSSNNHQQEQQQHGVQHQHGNNNDDDDHHHKMLDDVEIMPDEELTNFGVSAPLEERQTNARLRIELVQLRFECQHMCPVKFIAQAQAAVSSWDPLEEIEISLAAEVSSQNEMFEIELEKRRNFHAVLFPANTRLARFPYRSDPSALLIQQQQQGQDTELSLYKNHNIDGLERRTKNAQSLKGRLGLLGADGEYDDEFGEGEEEDELYAVDDNDFDAIRRDFISSALALSRVQGGMEVLRVPISTLIRPSNTNITETTTVGGNGGAMTTLHLNEPRIRGAGFRTSAAAAAATGAGGGTRPWSAASNGSSYSCYSNASSSNNNNNNNNNVPSTAGGGVGGGGVALSAPTTPRGKTNNSCVRSTWRPPEGYLGVEAIHPPSVTNFTTRPGVLHPRPPNALHWEEATSAHVGSQQQQQQQNHVLPGQKRKPHAPIHVPLAVNVDVAAVLSDQTFVNETTKQATEIKEKRNREFSTVMKQRLDPHYESGVEVASSRPASARIPRKWN